MRTMRCFLLPLLLLAAFSAGGATQDFEDWLAGLQEEARGQGISETVLQKAFSGVNPIDQIIVLDRHQPETTMGLEQYLRNVIPASRVAKARAQYRQYYDILEKIGAQYGIQPRFLVAFWGIESDFGRNQGGFSVVAALTTLAYDGRRSAYFRGELLDALRILQRGDVTPKRMVGSWAGAMGQVQFMPSVLLQYGVDYDGNGRCDLWGDRADVFASAANYLHGVGWQADEGWGTEVHLPPGFDRTLLGLEQVKTLREWRELGVSPVHGDAWTGDLRASIVQPDVHNDRIFAVYPNYRVIRIWNRSHYFATAVGLLADAVVAKPQQKTQHKGTHRTCLNHAKPLH